NAVSVTLVSGASAGLAVYWNAAEPGTPVHVLPGLGGSFTVTQATAVSGTLIVGTAHNPFSSETVAVCWNTAEPGPPVHVLTALGGFSTTPNGVSGTLVVGASAGRAVFWNTAEPGTPVHVLPDLSGGGVLPRALGVSGTRIVGLVGVPSIHF